MPYLLERGSPDSTWTLCTGAQGDLGLRAAPAMSQGALYSFATVACRDNEKTNVRFNEIYLAFRVQFELESGNPLDTSWTITTSSEFAPLYTQILDRTDIRSCRVNVLGPPDIRELKYRRKAE